MLTLSCPAPILEEHDGFVVVRDDLLLGGTKARVVPALMRRGSADEWVFAGPSQGYAQVALGVGVLTTNRRATFFCPERRERTALTGLAERLGVKIVEVPAGRLSVLEARAREYAAQTGAMRPPLGLAVSGMVDGLAAVARGLDYRPAEVWVAAGSGLLSRALAVAWPDARINAVQVGAAPRLSPRAALYVAREAFAARAAELPPYPSVETYDAKVWRFAREYGRRGALIWNVAGPCPGEAEVAAALDSRTLSLRGIANRSERE